MPLNTIAAGSDDYASDASTTGSISVGGSVTGNIEMAGDQDWFSITLEAGEIIDIALNNTSTLDPYLYLSNAVGGQVSSNDDGGAGLNSALTYTASTAGTYYVAAAGYGTRTGTYELEVTTPLPPLTQLMRLRGAPNWMITPSPSILVQPVSRQKGSQPKHSTRMNAGNFGPPLI